MVISKLQSDLTTVVAPLLQQHKEVWVALGCGRAYVGAVPSELCKRCGGVHTNIKIEKLEDLREIEENSSE